MFRRAAPEGPETRLLSQERLVERQQQRFGPSRVLLRHGEEIEREVPLRRERGIVAHGLQEAPTLRLRPPHQRLQWRHDLDRLAREPYPTPGIERANAAG
jgi:hypothetical protein